MHLKPPAHRAGLPGKVISFYIVPLDPAYKAGLAGHVPAISVVSLSNPCLPAPVPTEGGAGRCVVIDFETFSEISKKFLTTFS